MAQDKTDEEGDKSAPASEKDDVILDVKGLRCYFKIDEGTVRAVDGVSFKLKRREILGVVGESGSGKSVTQLALMGLIPKPPGIIAGGSAMFQGQDLLKISQRELRKLRGNKISMIFQDPMTSLNPFLRVSRQLEEVLEIHQPAALASPPEVEIDPLSPISAAEQKEIHRIAHSGSRQEKCIEILRQVGIPDPAKRYRQYPHQFSGGMRQRVMIAMALLCNPNLLIADEPTTALDVTIQAQILELIKALRDDFGTSVILITHDLGVVAGVSDRVMVMYAGRVMERATTRDLFKNPSHPYTIGLLRSVPRLDGAGDPTKGRLIPIPGLPPNVARPVPGCPFVERCPFAQDKCEEAFPESRMYGPEHEVFCWRADEVRAMSQEERDEAASRKATEMSRVD